MSKIGKSIHNTLTSSRFWISVVVVVVFVFYHFRLGDYFQFDTQGVLLAQRAQDFLTLTLAVILGALPFLVLGVVVSTLVSVYVDERTFLKLLPKNRILSHVAISGLGMFLPVCECGNIPLARRLVMKGFSVSQAMTFLLAAPVINIVTIVSTAQAFQLTPVVVISRVVATFIIANVVGVVLSYAPNQNEFFSEGFIREMGRREVNTLPRWQFALGTFRQEFMSVFKMLVVGAMIAALIRTFIPQDVIVGFAVNPVLAILAMMFLAFVIAICSSIDAFFALSLANIFPVGAIVSFLTLGPMLDVKIVSMLKASFSTKLLIIVSILVILGSFVAGSIISLI